MNARLASFLIPTALTLALAACGNKGPLVLPTAPPPPEPPKAKPGEVPVTISTVNAPPVATDPKKKASAVPSLDKMLTPPTDGQPAQGTDPATQDPAKQDPAKQDPNQKKSDKSDSSGGADQPAQPLPASGQGDG
ncbi:lipoprotein [Lysobacter enzymogenes]|uniref:LPS translocon maturation chaperone LptM n=1 Tax=Lysobacter enzymogenes TaxID=69 RepID=UPI00384F51D0